MNHLIFQGFKANRRRFRFRMNRVALVVSPPLKAIEIVRTNSCQVVNEKAYRLSFCEDVLVSDRAQVEVSKKVHDVLRFLCIKKDTQSEPYQQHQNSADSFCEDPFLCAIISGDSNDSVDTCRHKIRMLFQPTYVRFPL